VAASAWSLGRRPQADSMGGYETLCLPRTWFMVSQQEAWEHSEPAFKGADESSPVEGDSLASQSKTSHLSGGALT